jgi:hypothetical protein
MSAISFIAVTGHRGLELGMPVAWKKTDRSRADPAEKSSPVKKMRI